MYMIYYVCKMYYACTDKLGVVGLCMVCLCCCIEAKVVLKQRVVEVEMNLSETVTSGIDNITVDSDEYHQL